MWKIVIADDESIERTTLQEILEENLSNVQVRCAPDGAAALELAAVWKANIALLDIEMPVMNGIKAANGIRRALPDCQIIFLTAYGLFSYAQEALRLGVTDYILKPAEDSEVLKAVQKAIASAQKLQESKIENIDETETFSSLQTETEDGTVPFEKNAYVGTQTTNDKNSKLLSQIQSYLSTNYSQDISLESIAETLDFSPFYLSKLFKQTFGKSFIEYLIDIRISSAKQYLADPTLTTKEISELVGYPNSNYFTKLFKKKTGLTPTEYRMRTT